MPTLHLRKIKSKSQDKPSVGISLNLPKLAMCSQGCSPSPKGKAVVLIKGEMEVKVIVVKDIEH